MKVLHFLLSAAAVVLCAEGKGDNDDCLKWVNYCGTDNAWMKENCKATCANQTPKDSCMQWTSHCGKGNAWMTQHCKGTCSTDEDKKETEKASMCYTVKFEDPAPDPDWIMEEPGAGYAVKKLQENVWGLMSGAYNSLLVTGDNHAMLIDAGHNNADAILKGVKAILGETQLTHFLYGHVHHDHIGGADKVKAAYPDVKIVASTATNEVLKTLNSPSRPPADVVLTDLSNGLQAGGVDYQFTPLYSHGTDNMLVMVDGKTVFSADLINPGSAPFLQFAFANNYNLNLVKKDLQILKDLKWEVFLPGHNNRLGTREDIQLVLDYTDAVIASAGKALGTVQYGSTMMKYGLSQTNAMGYPGYRMFYEEVAKACEADIVAQWKKGDQTWKRSNLRSVDALASSHCWAAGWFHHMFAPGR